MSLNRKGVIRFLYSKLIPELERLCEAEGVTMEGLLKKLCIDKENYNKLKMIRDIINE